MRVLLMTTADPSHLPPLAPLAWTLRAAGHDVLVAGQPDSAESARSAGLNFVSFGTRFNTEEQVRNSLAPDKRPLESRPRPSSTAPDGIQGGFGGVWCEHAKEVVGEYLDFAHAWSPDLILSDSLDYSALMLGGVLCVPAVHYRWGVDPIGTPRLPYVRKDLHETCRALGLETLPDPNAVLDPCPRALQLPELEPQTPVRYVPFNGPGQVPDWLRGEWCQPHRSGAKRVVVSLGRRTLVYNGVSFVRALLHAFSQLRDVELIATVDVEHQRMIGPVPDNVRMVEPFPLHLVLDDTDAIITHGGSATTMTATLFGVPQLALPQMADCFAHGDRLAATGAGISFDTVAEQDDATLLSEALTELLRDARYRKVAGELSAQMRAMPAPARVVGDLEALVRR